MLAQTKTLRTCKNGHNCFKISDCPVCLLCEKELNISDNFLSKLSRPARRALENKGITTVAQLSNFTQKQILQLHGIGPSSLPKLNKALESQNLTFRIDK